MHPGPGHASGTLVNALIAHCGASLSGIGGVQAAGHRAPARQGHDRPAGGGQDGRGARGAVAEQFAAHGADGRLERRYLALVWGAPERPRGAIDAALARSSANRTKIAVVREEAGRHAVTRYEVLETYGGEGKAKPIASLLELALETGRTHQIRVHLAHVGHPLLGDMTYGAGFKASARKLAAEAQAALEALGRQALHAGVLAFVHPVTGKRLRFRKPDARRHGPACRRARGRTRRRARSASAATPLSPTRLGERLVPRRRCKAWACIGGIGRARIIPW